MKPEKQDRPYRFLDEKRQAIIEAAPSPMPDAINLDAAISELEGQASIYHGVGKSDRQRFNGKAPVVADRTTHRIYFERA
jgi:hypothetical protein